jgi:hypothetical protein
MGIPRSFNAAAMARRLRQPAACSSATSAALAYGKRMGEPLAQAGRVERWRFGAFDIDRRKPLQQLNFFDCSKFALILALIAALAALAWVECLIFSWEQKILRAI